jgi:PAS domain S-box-containing protein
LVGGLGLLFDLSLPLGVAGGVPYVALVLVGLGAAWRPYILVLALASTVLTLTGYALSPEGGTPWMVATNRLLALFAIWVVAVLLYRHGRATDAIAVSNARYRRLAELEPDAIVIVAAGRVLFANSAAAELAGVAGPAELIGESPRQLLIGEERDRAIAQLTADLAGPNAAATVKARIRRDGEERLVDLEAAPTVFEGTEAAHVVVRDVTERRLANRALRQQAALLELIGEASTSANLAPSFEDALRACLDLVCRHTDWPVGHVYFCPDDAGSAILPTEIWHLDDDERFAAFRGATDRTSFARGQGLPGRVWQSGEPAWIGDIAEDPNFPRAAFAARSGVHAGFAFPVLEKDRVVAVLEFFSERPLAADEPLLRMSTHIGTQLSRVLERQRARQAIVEAKELADRANTAKTRFLSNMSHELRTPLNAILGFSELMSSEVMGPFGNAKYKEYSKDIATSGGHLLRIINDLLDLARIEAGRAELVEESVDLAEVVASSLRMLEPAAIKNGIDLAYELPPDLPPIKADAGKVRQILINLLSNAIKFTPSGGRVSVGVDKHDDGEVVMSVSDNGQGISEAEIQTVMEPFGRLENAITQAAEGTGLGLPLTKGLCELHGGRLEIHSTVGVGTTARAVFPEWRFAA